MADAFAWLAPWYAVTDPAICAGLEHQLKREIGKRHILWGKPAKLIVRRDAHDDALFVLDDGRVAEVHMTWSKRRETDPRWPVTAIFASLEDWARESMAPLHEEWTRDD